VLGDTRNIKVTFPEDLVLAELMLESRQRSAVSRQPKAKRRRVGKPRADR
jgi:hypothetical protein